MGSVTSRVKRVAALLFLSAGLSGCGPTIRDSLVIVYVEPGTPGPVSVSVGNRTIPITTDAQVPFSVIP